MKLNPQITLTFVKTSLFISETVSLDNYVSKAFRNYAISEKKLVKISYKINTCAVMSS